MPENETRGKDLCNTCWKKPVCHIRMKGDFHLAECSHYFADQSVDESGLLSARRPSIRLKNQRRE